MFNLPDTKSFMDNIHGYIRIPKIFIKYIIDTLEFQRLRNIDQTGMKVLFPAGKHDRFSHSLGVFHLGSIAVDALLKNFLDNSHWKIRSDKTRDVFWAKNKLLFLIACLLHDIGHAPFSHSLERFYEFDVDNDRISDLMKLLDIDFGSETGAETTALYTAKEHERMSSFLLLQRDGIWRKRIKSILDELKGYYPKYTEEIYEEHRVEPPTINSDELDKDIQFIARMILGVKYVDYHPEMQIRNCFIELLNGNFDVDKLDYTIRDTVMSGIGNITLDIERLLTSLTIISKTIYIKRNVVIEAKKPVIISRMEVNNNSTLIIKKGRIDKAISLDRCSVIFPKNTTLTLNPKDSKTNFGIDTEGARVKNDSIIIAKHEKVKQGSERTSIPRLDDGSLELKNTTLLEEWKVEFKGKPKEPSNVEYDSEQYNVIFDNLFSNEEIKISLFKDGAALNLSSLDEKECTPLILQQQMHNNNSIEFLGYLEGYVDRLEILSDELFKYKECPTNNCYTGFSIGFKKQAINLISNVSDARNYLYLWIYSHHKVIYYANYLIVELSRISIAKQLEGETLSTMMNKMMLDKDDAHKLDEDFIHTKIRTTYKYFSQRYDLLYHQFASRCYRTSLYKSLAEFDLIFVGFDDEMKNKMRLHLENISIYRLYEKDELQLIDDSISIMNDTKNRYIKIFKYGEINPAYLKEMISEKGFYLFDILEDIIWVSSNPSLRRPSPSSIYIMFGNQEITTMDRLPILKRDDLKVEQQYYFNLYYQKKNEEILEAKGIKDNEIKKIISDAFVNYMRKILYNNIDFKKDIKS